MEISSSTKQIRRKLLKQAEKVHEAQAKADKLPRKALASGKTNLQKNVELQNVPAETVD
jgi:hypothetical protein